MNEEFEDLDFVLEAKPKVVLDEKEWASLKTLCKAHQGLVERLDARTHWSMGPMEVTMRSYPSDPTLNVDTHWIFRNKGSGLLNHAHSESDLREEQAQLDGTVWRVFIEPSTPIDPVNFKPREEPFWTMARWELLENAFETTGLRPPVRQPMQRALVREILQQQGVRKQKEVMPAHCHSSHDGRSSGFGTFKSGAALRPAKSAAAAASLSLLGAAAAVSVAQDDGDRKTHVAAAPQMHRVASLAELAEAVYIAAGDNSGKTVEEEEAELEQLLAELAEETHRTADILEAQRLEEEAAELDRLFAQLELEASEIELVCSQMADAEMDRLLDELEHDVKITEFLMSMEGRTDVCESEAERRRIAEIDGTRWLSWHDLALNMRTNETGASPGLPELGEWPITKHIFIPDCCGDEPYKLVSLYDVGHKNDIDSEFYHAVVMEKARHCANLSAEEIYKIETAYKIFPHPLPELTRKQRLKIEYANAKLSVECKLRSMRIQAKITKKEVKWSVKTKAKRLKINIMGEVNDEEAEKREAAADEAIKCAAANTAKADKKASKASTEKVVAEAPEATEAKQFTAAKSAKPDKKASMAKRFGNWIKKKFSTETLAESSQHIWYADLQI